MTVLRTDTQRLRIHRSVSHVHHTRLQRAICVGLGTHQHELPLAVGRVGHEREEVGHHVLLEYLQGRGCT